MKLSAEVESQCGIVRRMTLVVSCEETELDAQSEELQY
jgi:hypothetical protein